jgi:hypothetical protein
MRRLFISVTGFTAVATYVIFPALSMSKYPDIYSPFTNWLSDLGNPLVNPSGALIYNLGCVLISLVLVAFFIGLRCRVNDNKRLKILLIRNRHLKDRDKGRFWFFATIVLYCLNSTWIASGIPVSRFSPFIEAVSLP